MLTLPMPDDRLKKARGTLPKGYQFGANRGVHLHSFNAVSGYCECGLQYCPYLHKYFPEGGRVGEPSLVNDRERFITLLGPTDTIAPCPEWRPLHENAADRLARYQTAYVTGRDLGDEG